MQAHLEVLRRHLPAPSQEQLSAAAANQLNDALHALGMRMKTLADALCEGDASGAAELAQLMRGLAKHAPRCATLAASYAAAAESMPLHASFEREPLTVASVGMLAAACGVLAGLEAMEQRQALLPASGLAARDMAALLHWQAGLFPAAAAFLRHALLSADALTMAKQSVGPTAWLLHRSLLRFVSHAGEPLCAAGLEQAWRGVPLLLGCLVPALGMIAQPDHRGTPPEAWQPLLALLLNLLEREELGDAAQACLASGSEAEPLGRQLVYQLLLFLRCLAKHSSQAGSSNSTAVALSTHSMPPRELNCWNLAMLILLEGAVKPHLNGAMAHGPASLQLQRVLLGMFSRLCRLKEAAGGSPPPGHLNMLTPGVTLLSDLLCLHTVALEALLPGSGSASWQEVHARHQQQPRQQPPLQEGSLQSLQPPLHSRRPAEGEQSPLHPQQLEQQCIATSLLCWHTVEATPDVAAVLTASALEAADQGATTLAIWAWWFSFLQKSFLALGRAGFFPRWRQAQAELLPAAMEAALRCAGQLQRSRAMAEDSGEVAEQATRTCSVALAYVLVWAARQRQQLAAVLEKQSCEAVLACLTALASTALKCAAAQLDRTDHAASVLGMDSHAAELTGLLRLCALLAAAVQQSAQQPSARAERLVCCTQLLSAEGKAMVEPRADSELQAWLGAADVRALATNLYLSEAHALSIETEAQLQQLLPGAGPSLEQAVAATHGSESCSPEAAAVQRVQALAALPCCAHLRCTNLAGASEAGLRTRACSGCRVARYCSAACQKADWRAGHRRMCAALAAARVEERAAA